ncbi:MAG: hypothetical protein IPL05_20830 [Betaproteobacteria bacterium]|nr:hypothetical protein [Betaproteobacteria bacterium]
MKIFSNWLSGTPGRVIANADLEVLAVNAPRGNIDCAAGPLKRRALRDVFRRHGAVTPGLALIPAISPGA